jgi:ring-1,2-phenylacetyl-CoA epoxidase subunit PaaE
MALLKFLKKKDKNKVPKGFFSIRILKVTRLTSKSVKIEFDIPESAVPKFGYTPGQYLDFSFQIEGAEHRRSYSICSAKNETLAIAVKEMENGTVSKWFNREAKAGDEVYCTPPNGLFTLESQHKNIVAFAAGSGITPILSMAKNLENNDGKLTLFYGNRSKSTSIFLDELESLKNTTTTLFFSGEKVDGTLSGRITGDSVSEQVKANLELLKADAFFLCGPIQMIESVREKLIEFGVSESKIKRELFSAPVEDKKKSKVTAHEIGSKVKVILDGDEVVLKYKPKGKGILEMLDGEGFDAPYSCRGGVCSTCKAKVLEGSADMKLNYVLTDQEVEDGFILCCQAIPTSENVTISFDE